MMSSTLTLVRRETPGVRSEILLCENQICPLQLTATCIVLPSFTPHSLPVNWWRENVSPRVYSISWRPDLSIGSPPLLSLPVGPSSSLSRVLGASQALGPA